MRYIVYMFKGNELKDTRSFNSEEQAKEFCDYANADYETKIYKESV